MTAYKVLVRDGTGSLVKEWTGIGEVKPLAGPLFILIMLPVVGDQPKAYQVLGAGYSAEIVPDIA